jgi:hypothetical protein
VTIKTKYFRQKPTFVVTAVIGAMLLVGCAQSGVVESDRMLNPYTNEPEVAWTADFPSESGRLSFLLSWPERSAVVAIFEPEVTFNVQDSPGPTILFLDVETGDVIDEAFVLDLAPVEGDWSDYYLGAEILRSGELRLLVTPNFRVEDSHLVLVAPTSFDDTKTLSVTNSFIAGFALDFDKDAFLLVDRDTNELTFLGPDLEPAPDSATVNIEGYDLEGLIPSIEGLIFADRSSDRSVVFEFYDPETGIELYPPLVLSRGSDSESISFVAELGGGLLFASGEEGSDRWELLLVDWEGEILETRNARVAEGSEPDGFVAVNSDQVFLIEEFRDDFSVVVLNSALEETAALPVNRVNNLVFSSQFAEKERGNQLILIDEGSFALLDTASNEVSRFRALADGVLGSVGVGYSRDAFFVQDRGRLTSYSFDLESNWNFNIRDDEAIFRAGRYLFLVDSEKETLMLLADGP